MLGVVLALKHFAGGTWSKVLEEYRTRCVGVGWVPGLGWEWI
jgi:hypothetical protein